MSAQTILFISVNPVWGGSELLWAHAASLLSRSGHRVAAVVDHANLDHREVSALRLNGVEVYAHTVPPTNLKRLRRAVFRRQSGLAAEIDEILSVADPALMVLSTGACLFPIDVLALCVDRKRPFVTIAQANDVAWWCDDEQGQRYRELLPLARRCYFVSEGNWRLAEKQLGCEIRNGEVIHNPFNVDYDAAPAWPRFDDDNPLRLACVARLEPTAKGQDILLEALADPDWIARSWRLTLYGEGRWRHSLEWLIGRFGLNEQVRFAGHVSDVERIWAENHVLVMPSRFEGLPLAMVEAMLCGRPVVTTDVGGNREIVEDGVTGFIADAPTPLSLGEALERLWVRRDDLERMGRMAAESIRAKVPPDPVAVFAAKIEAHCWS